jgi:anti-anti-sigma factor
MQPGQILVANQSGTYVIKMLGDVRLTLCMSFDEFIDNMFADSGFSLVLFDLSEAEAIDSTTLGLMAKISILGSERRNTTPMVFSTNPSISRLLESMGFGDIFDIVHKADLPDINTLPLLECDLQEAEVKSKVIAAHRILMNLNDSNRETFKDLVNILETD